MWPAGKNYVTVVSSDASSENMKDEAEMKNNFKQKLLVGGPLAV